MWDYGNARVAARRSHLLGAEAIERLAESGSATAALAQLERQAEWRDLIRPLHQVAVDPATTFALAVESFRSGELRALPRWYEGRPRRLVEALVLGLDRERVLAILRRRRAGQEAEAINPTIVGGALLDGATLADLARQPSPSMLIASLGRRHLLDEADARRLARLAPTLEPAALESALGVAWDRARLERAAGGGADARFVRQVIEEERRDRDAVREELEASGPAGASLVERSLRIARLDRLAHGGRRDTDGVGAVVGHVAAVEAQAIRLRTALARVAAGWTRQVARAFLPAEV